LVVGGFCIFMVVYIFLVRILQNIHFIYQLLYGLGIGYIIYYVFYEILEVDFSNKEQFREILNSPILISIICVIVFTLTNVIHYNLELKNPNNDYYLTNIKKYCVINEIFSFDHESYTKSTRIFEFLGYFLGIYLEYVVVFSDDYEKFANYNIDSKYEMFNKTSNIKTLIRVLIMFVNHCYIISSFIMNKYQKTPEESMFYSMMVRLTIPYFFEGIFNFFVLKLAMRFINLTNNLALRNNKLTEKI